MAPPLNDVVLDKDVALSRYAKVFFTPSPRLSKEPILPQGKVALYSTALEKFGYHALPQWVEPPESITGTPELLRVAQVRYRHLGVDNIRITGGEPLVRGDIVEVVRQLATITVRDPARIEHLVPRALAQAVVITVSDRCSRGEAEDSAGPAVAEALVASRFAHVYMRETIADDRSGIAARQLTGGL
jgi:hypothetical protein